MPELPEVEVTRQALIPHLQQQTIAAVQLYRQSLRWPIAPELQQVCPGGRIVGLSRRGKYLLLKVTELKRARAEGTVIIHLGMTGCCRILPIESPRAKHDHMDMCLTNGLQLRFSDPRRFGALLWTDEAPAKHPLLMHLGPEPLHASFDGGYLHQRAQKSRCAIKTLLMNHKVVVGVGNIYAMESLFAAGIKPSRPANTLSKKRLVGLVQHIKQILQASIDRGGTTFRDFLRPEGQPGYFKQALQVYGRAGQPCRQCQSELQQQQITGRSTVFCAKCQR